jgi:hypothetical protein
MKNKNIVFGLLVFVLVGGMTIFGCASKSNTNQDVTYDTTPTKFEGTWKGTGVGSDNKLKETEITFTGNKIVFSVIDVGSVVGTFTFTDTEITADRQLFQGYEESVLEYIISENVLTLTGKNLSRAFTKE